METQTLIPAITPAVVAIIAAQADRLQRARELLAEVESIESGMRRDRDRLLETGWHLGEVLAKMQDDLGHGRWLPFLAGYLPKLGRRNASRCITFYRENDKWVESTHLPFDTDSVRKFMWQYIPEKERPELEGDEKVQPVAHPLTFVNHYFKWKRQLSQGHAGPRPPVDQLRRDFTPVILDQVELLGRDWLLGLIEHAATADVRG